MAYKTGSALFFMVLVAAVAFFLRQYYDAPGTGIDDANIYHVYMQHLAAGHGLVFTPGGERVEGFTSLLWVVLGAACAAIGSPLEPCLGVLSAVFVVTLLIRLAWQLPDWTGIRTPVGPLALLATWLLAVPGYFDWTLPTLMETALWSLVLTNLAVDVVMLPATRGAAWRLAAWLGVLALVRPEAMFWGPFFIGLRGVTLHRGGGRPGDWLRQLAVPAAVLLLVLAGLTAWRLTYFGFPLPNTFYAKVSASLTDNVVAGIRYFGAYMVHYNGMIVAVYAGLLAYAWRTARRGGPVGPERALAILALIGVVNPALALLTGGDHFAMGRMFQPLLPLTYAVFGAIGARFLSRKSFTIGAMVLVLAAVWSPDFFRCYDYFTRQNSPLEKEFRIAREGRALGRQLNEFFGAPDTLPSVGVVCAGGIAAAYDGPINDVLGLNNVAMAHAQAVKPRQRRKNHAAFDRAVFFRQQPDLFLATEVVADTAGHMAYWQQPDLDTDFFAVAVDHVFRDPRFAALYVPAAVRRRDGQMTLFSYFRRDFLDRLPAGVYEITRYDP